MDVRNTDLLVEQADKENERWESWHKWAEESNYQPPCLTKEGITQNTKRLVLDALYQVAGVCDGARTLDGVGFNGTDTNFGRNLAESAQRYRDNLTNGQAAAAAKMLRKYRKQIDPVTYAALYGCSK